MVCLRVAFMRKTYGYCFALNNLPFKTDNDNVQRQGPGKLRSRLLSPREPSSSGLAGERGNMEKICIVKRRKPNNEGTFSPHVETERVDRSPLVSIQLTTQQAEAMRSNEHFQRLYNAKSAPIYLNLHFNEGPLQKMLKASEICEILQVSKNTLGKLLRDGVVKSYKIGRLRRFAAEDIMEYLAGSFGLGRLNTIHVDISQRRAAELETSSI